MFRPLPLLLGLLFLIEGSVGASSAFAQPRYYPLNGPISPWMNMFQRNPGPLDNYNSYVRPQLELQNILTQQAISLQQQQRGLQALSQNVANINREERIAPTGTSTGSVFMNYLHYYPQGASGYNLRRGRP